MNKSIGLDEETYSKLEKLANKNSRTLIGQIRHMIEVSK
jgi:predicted DNA-binding protein